MIKLTQGVTSDSEPLPNPMTWEEYARFTSKQARYCIDEKTGALELIGEERPRMQSDGKMSQEEYYAFVEKTFAGMLALIKKKNYDYVAGAGDAFANFRRSEPVVDCLKGAWVRWGDKVQRVDAFFKNGKLAVENEGLDDALKDCLGYSMVMLGIIHERIKQGVK
jgi:hypothetical protein